MSVTAVSHLADNIIKELIRGTFYNNCELLHIANIDKQNLEEMRQVRLYLKERFLVIIYLTIPVSGPYRNISNFKPY